MTPLVERLFGADGVDAAFPNQAVKAVCPFPRAGHVRNGLTPHQRFTPELMASPVHLTEVDPCRLWSSQGWVVRQHAAYYLNGAWERSGVTSADRESASNRWPVVVIDHLDRPVIVAGHHRSLAALLQRRPLVARVFPSEPDTAVALLSLLLVGEGSRLPHVRCDTVDAAVEAVRCGQRALCLDPVVAMAALRDVRKPAWEPGQASHWGRT